MVLVLLIIFYTEGNGLRKFRYHVLDQSGGSSEVQLNIKFNLCKTIPLQMSVISNLASYYYNQRILEKLPTVWTPLRLKQESLKD